ncbi:MAG: YaaL family protein [Defluviitaleaceae bacterium]|nr:YaaL family protein [Defluviitaleaceae bacterium]
MAHFTQTVAYAPKPETCPPVAAPPTQTNNLIDGETHDNKPEIKARRKLFKKSKRLTREDMEIVAALEAVKSDMEFLHNCFDHTTDAVLVDSLVYELKAANLKYQYYLNLCKEKGIVYGTMPK